MYKIIGADGNQYGPVTLEQLQQWLAEGRVNAQTLVQAGEAGEWKPLGSFPELGGVAGSPAPVAVAPVASAAQPVTPGAKVPNYLWQAIAVTLCCCMPFGIAAIVFASQVNSKVAAGDMAGALESSRKARLWCWWAFGVGLPVQIGVAIVQFMAVMAQSRGLQ